MGRILRSYGSARIERTGFALNQEVNLEQKRRMRIVFPIRSLDCVHYSLCLMKAAQELSLGESFSCTACQKYEREEMTEWDKVLETIGALKMLEAVWKEKESKLDSSWILSASAHGGQMRSQGIQRTV